MNELRLLFNKASEGRDTAHLDHNCGGGTGQPFPREPSPRHASTPQGT